MEQKPLCPPNAVPFGALLSSPTEVAKVDLIFMQDFGPVPKQIGSASRPDPLPAAQRKWLGADFSHIIISQ